MDKICFLNGHLLRDIDYFKKIIVKAIENPSGQDYCGILDLIWEGSLENWVKLFVNEQQFYSINQICSDIRNKNITEYDGANKISLLFDVKGQESVSREDYISFDNSNLRIMGDANFQFSFSMQDPCEYKIKTDENWPSIYISTDCTLLKSIDHLFEFLLVLQNKRNNKTVKIEHAINPRKYFDKGEKRLTIKIDLKDKLEEGEYSISLEDKRKNGKESIQTTSLEIIRYNYHDCYKLHSIIVSGDALFKHKKRLDTNILVEKSVNTICVSLQHEIIKHVDQNFKLKLEFGDTTIQLAEVIDTKEKTNCTFTIPVKDLTAGMYPIKITSEGKVLSDSHSIYITGGKRKIKIKDDVELNFIEIVDDGFHYLVSESIITNDIYCKVMGDKMENKSFNNRHPHIFGRKNKNDNFFKDADDFLYILSILSKRKIEKISKRHWEHCMDNGSIDCKVDLKSLARYANNSKNHMHEVKSLKPNLLGLYDICGNIWTLTNDVDSHFFSNEYILVGGCYSSSESSLRKDIKVKSDSEIQFGLRLMVQLPKIEDSREKRERGYNCYSSSDVCGNSWMEREIAEPYLP